MNFLRNTVNRLRCKEEAQAMLVLAIDLAVNRALRLYPSRVFRLLFSLSHDPQQLA